MSGARQLYKQKNLDDRDRYSPRQVSKASCSLSFLATNRVDRRSIAVTNRLLSVFFLRGIFGNTPNSGSYFNCIMFMVASSVVLTVMVLNFHHRSADRYVMKQWVRNFSRCKSFLVRVSFAFCGTLESNYRKVIVESNVR